MKKLFLFSMLLMCLTSFVSCSSDDEDNRHLDTDTDPNLPNHKPAAVYQDSIR